MKTIVILAAIGLIIGMTGGVAARRAVAPVNEAVLAAAAPVAHDTAAAAAAVAPEQPLADTTPQPLPAPEDAVVTNDTVPPPVSTPPAPSPAIQQVAEMVPATRPTLPTVDGARRLARIFGAMKPDQAAAVLQELDDADVREILFGMTERNAGAILSHMPPARAAALSRSALRRSQP